jgi:hypothetical protein
MPKVQKAVERVKDTHKNTKQVPFERNRMIQFRIILLGRNEVWRDDDDHHDHDYADTDVKM